MAKRLVRLGKYLAVTGTVYRPKALMDPDTPKATLAAYYQSVWEKLLPKWRAKADLREVFGPQHPLGQWRQMAQELYALELRLPQQRAAQNSIKVRRRRGGVMGIGTGPTWLVFYPYYCGAWHQALSIREGNTSRTAPVRFNAGPYGRPAGSCSKVLQSAQSPEGQIPAQA
jgi:hypothetical protein